jgi:NTE family protein
LQLVNLFIYQTVVKRELIILLFALLSLCINGQDTVVSPVNGQDTVRRPKIGLVLSGGGAKGFAHVGALKVIEEAGISIDYITGTSIGSIVGGLYAIGYNAASLEQVMGSQNWEKLLSNDFKREYIPVITKEEQARYLLSLPIKSNKISIPEGVLNGQNAMELFTYLSFGYLNELDFSTLPIPFKCIAADITTGEEVVLDKGFLPEAMRASMSVPAVFSACEINNRMLVDGGIINNFPVDRCREMGADIIIGIDIGDALMSKEKITSIPDMITQLSTLLAFERSNKNRENVDILIKPDISGFSATSFNTSAANVLMKRGEEAARKILPQLIRMRDSLGLGITVKQPRTLPDINTPIHVDNIVVEGTEKTNIISILGKMGIDKDKKTTLNEIRHGVARIYATGNYQKVDYRISGDDKKIVTIVVKESSTNKLNVGLHYDSDLKAAALINMTLNSNRISGSTLSLDAKLSSSPFFIARYTLDRGSKPGFISSASIISDKLWGFENGHKVSEINVQMTNLQIGTQVIAADILRISLGSSLEFYHFGAGIGTIDSTEIKERTFINYFLKGTVDEFDNPNFPNNGWAMNGIFKLVTDNGWNYNGKSPFAMLGLNFKWAKQISNRVVVLPSFNTHFTFATLAPIFYKSYIGGFQETNYFGNYLQFAGLRRMELSADNVAYFRLDIRTRMWKKIYTTLISNIGINGDHISFLENSNVMLGGAISVAYNSVVGPVEVSFGTSNMHEKITPYFSLGYSF